MVTAEEARTGLHNLCEQHSILQTERDVNDAVDGTSADDVAEGAHVDGIQSTVINIIRASEHPRLQFE